MSMQLKDDAVPSRRTRRSTPVASRKRLCQHCRKYSPNRMNCAKFKVTFGTTSRYVCVPDLGNYLKDAVPGDLYVVEILP